MRKYPDFKDELPLSDLLEWDLWPSYISIHGTESMYYQGLIEPQSSERHATNVQ